MIKLGNYNLSGYGLKVEKVNGLYDFPSIKSDGLNWTDQNYTEALSRLQDFQYESRRITLDCFIQAADWSTLQSRLNSLATVLVADNVHMLTMPDYSNLGHIVRLVRTTIFNPHRYFDNNQAVATFQIVFEEPQPFAIKLYWDFSAVDAEADIMLGFTIKKVSKSLSFNSDSQRFVTIHFDAGVGNGQGGGIQSINEINLEQDDFEWTSSVPMSHDLHPLTIVGNIDSIEDVSVISTYPVQFKAAMTGFLRNGEFSNED